jgi:hypothetical protein
VVGNTLTDEAAERTFAVYLLCLCKAEDAVPRIIAEFTEPVSLQLKAVDDHQFPVELSVRGATAGTLHPLALRYTDAEAALRDSVAFQERLDSEIGELHDALTKRHPAQSSAGTRRVNPAAWVFLVALCICTVTLLAPNLRTEYGAFLPIWISTMMLVLGMEWVRRREQGVEVIPVGDPSAAVEEARAVMVLLHRPRAGNVLTPAIRLDDYSGAAIRYLVPAAAESGIPKSIPLEALVQHAQEEIERPRRLREAQERKRAERRHMDAGVRNANLTLDSLQELNTDARPAAE